MKRRERIKIILLLAMVLVLLAGGLTSFRSVRPVKKPAYEQMCAAARQMGSCMEELKAERLRRGLPIDESEDRFATGLLGTGHTAITTTLGNLEAKRTACQPDMAALVVDMLTEAGVKIYEYTPGFVHAKVFVSDDEKAVVGTINLDYRSLYHHFECATYLYRTSCISEIEQDFQQTLKKCRRVTKESVRNEKLSIKIRGRILKLFAPLM
jgi:phosphatidylserine/phosphatidylglycerophosphate/cardiolipin synthase-like enzyme